MNDLRNTYQLSQIHEGWESVYRAQGALDRLNAAMRRRVLQSVRPAPGGLLLDAGCGVGYHTLGFARHGLRCVGIDISETILQTARANAARSGLADGVRFQCDRLEDLSFASETFDLVHCRGVLMHIPQWEDALAELCRVLKPGGSLVLFESNTTAVETCLVRLLRRFRSTVSRVVDTPGGLEFWSEVSGEPYLVRVTRIDHLVRLLAGHGLTVSERWASEFWDVYRFPSASRHWITRFNHLWFALGLPSVLSVGNCVIARKGRRSSRPPFQSDL